MSHEFAKFCKSWDIIHVTSSPYNSKANGKAESAVKTCKQIMRKSKDACSDPYLAILDHRNTPSQGFLSSPAQRLMSRRTKTLLPTASALLRPEVVDARHTERDMKRSQTQQATYYNKRASDRQVLEEGDTVRLQPFRLGRKDWSRGTVVKRLDERSYVVDTPTGVLRRNRQHLRKTHERYEHQQAAVIPVPQILPSAREVTPATERPAQPASNNVPPGSPMRQPSAMTRSPERSDATTRSGRAIRLPARYRE